MNRFITALFIVCIAVSLAGAGERKPVKPARKDKCAVCGMFVSGYPDFGAQIVFKDGSAAFFDGNKDMFKYYLDMKRYAPAKKEADIDSIYVMDYYGLVPVDGRSAFYVMGSDVMGPMGQELISFRKEAEAKSFRKDHKGKKIVTFKEVSKQLLGDLE